MALGTDRRADPPIWLGALFDRIVCGVDGTESSRVAVAQATRLLSARRMLELVSVAERSPGARPESDAAEMERRHVEARRALRAGRAECPRARSLLLFGDPGPMLVSAAREAQATLVVAGAPASGRLGPTELGSVGTHLLHSAPCSVLIARPSAFEAAFPRSIVVGDAGSRGGAAAAEVAKELAHRFDAELRSIDAAGADELVESSTPLVEALATASAEADLLVVAAGSLGEEIGRRARCSVLVVREPSASATYLGEGVDALPGSEC